MPQRRLLNFLIGCEQRGGLVSHRRLAGGDDVPYEINISWWSAMADGGLDPAHLQRQRFLLTEMLKLVLPGIPAFYLPALLASPNDLARFRQSGHRRDLNRPQFNAAALERRLDDPDSDTTAVLMALRQALTLRAELPALHPDSVLDVLSPDRVDRVVLRCSHQGHSLVAVHNFTASRLTFDPTALGGRDDRVWVDRLTDQQFAPLKRHALEPYAVLWLVQP